MQVRLGFSSFQVYLKSTDCIPDKLCCCVKNNFWLGFLLAKLKYRKVWYISPPTYYPTSFTNAFHQQHKIPPTGMPNYKKSLLIGIYLSKISTCVFLNLKFFSYCLIILCTTFANFCPLQEINPEDLNTQQGIYVFSWLLYVSHL